jgi:hypothetical protein
MKEINYSAIKDKLESIKCSTHNLPPTITVHKDGVNIESCCESFQKLLTDKFIKLTGESAVDNIKDSLDNMIKKINKSI